MKVVASKQQCASVTLAVPAGQTIADACSRLATAFAVPFSDHALVRAGAEEALAGDLRLSECGVCEGEALDFVVRASEATFVEQLAELLQLRPVAAEELALLYAHRYGSSAQTAMKMIGLDESLLDFLGSQKRFSVCAGSVALACKADVKVARTDTVTVHVSVKAASFASRWTDEDAEGNPPLHGVNVSARFDETVACLMARATAAAGTSSAFPEVEVRCEGKAVATEKKLAELPRLCAGADLELLSRASEASLLGQLVDLLAAPIPVEELGLLYSCRHGVGVDEVLGTLGLPSKERLLSQFLGHRPQAFAVQGGCVGRAGGILAPSMPSASPHDRCLEIHARVSSRAFRAAAAAPAGRVAALVLEGPAALSGVHHFVTGGAVGKGTAVSGAADAEVTLFLEGAPALGSPASGAFWRDASARLGVILATCDAGAVAVRLAPACRTHCEALAWLRAHKALGEAAGKAEASLFTTILAEQETRFIKKQPEAIKTTARLLKAWRGRMPWSSVMRRPSDRLLELLSVHSAAALQPGARYDHADALERITSLMANFGSLCVVWPTPFYGSMKVSEALLEQRPLLMDPVDPLVNLADPSLFDPTEMQCYANGGGAGRPHEINQWYR